ncbi:MAG: nucleoside-diphosphate sugar epimerase/dehydratase, partial [Fibrobacterota bacterium]
YYPEIEIIHFKGKSSAQNKIASRVAFYRAMLLFSEKYRKSYGSFFPRGVIQVGIALQGAFNLFSIVLRQFKMAFIDFTAANLSLGITTLLYAVLRAQESFYASDPWAMGGIHLLISLCFILPFIYPLSKPFGGGRRGVILGAAFGFLCYLSGLFVLRNIAFSRLMLIPAGLISAFSSAAWRISVPVLSGFYRRYISRLRTTVLVADACVAEEAVRISAASLENPVIRGILTVEKTEQATIGGYPVLGTVDELAAVLAQYRADRLIIASEGNWYSRIIELLSRGVLRGTSIMWLPVSGGNPVGEKLREFSV